jgi:hypothetical protein
MFANPASSSFPAVEDGGVAPLAYLQAVLPDQSAVSGYNLTVLDRDGSNRRGLFPPEGSAGLEPQTPAWAPGELPEQPGRFVAVVYQGNIWLVEIQSGSAYQVTGDGLASRLDWR